METILVTIAAADGDHDLELPADSPVEVWAGALGAVVADVAPDAVKLRTQEGASVDGSSTLAGAGVLEGELLWVGRDTAHPAPERVDDQPTLSVDVDGRGYEFPDQEVTIGRDAECEVLADVSLVSRRHLVLSPDGRGQWEVTDPGSSNGTFRDGSPFTSQVLTDELTLRIGHPRMGALVTLRIIDSSWTSAETGLRLRRPTSNTMMNRRT